MQTLSSPSPRTSVSGGLLWVLALASGMAPLATDMYLPALPEIATQLNTSVSTVQLTLSAFLLGLGIGQYTIGAISDRIGRRPLFLAGFALSLIASIISALAWDIWALVVARFVMGLGFAAAAVLGRAVISDCTSGTLLGKQLSLMMVIQSVMPIAAPVIGSLMVPLIGWRGTMWILVAASAVFLALVAATVPETLPPENRPTASFWSVMLAPVKLMAHRHFFFLIVTFAAGFGVIFAYISASSYVLQETLGLSTLEYGLVFAINAIVMTLASALNARLIDRFRYTTILFAGLVIACIGVIGVMVEAFGTPRLLGLVVAVSVTSAGVGVILPNVTTLLMQDAQDRGQDGAGSAIIGGMQAVAAAVVAPLVGLGGENATVPMAIVMASCTLLAILGTAAAAVHHVRTSAQPASAH